MNLTSFSEAGVETTFKANVHKKYMIAFGICNNPPLTMHNHIQLSASVLTANTWIEGFT
jgi:hypothetical protein